MRKREPEPDSEARSVHEARRMRLTDLERRSRKDRRRLRASGPR